MQSVGIAIVMVVQCLAALFWLSQIIRVLITDMGIFEDHKHKMLWFLVVVLVPLVGAIWFAVWLRREADRRAEQQAQQDIERFAEDPRSQQNT